MSIISEAERIKGNIENAYMILAGKGADIPEAQNSANLSGAIQSIPSGAGEAENLLLTPVYVYGYKSSSTTSSSSANNYIKVNIKGKKTLKISGKYSKQRGGCSLSVSLLKSVEMSNGALSLGARIDSAYSISGITAATNSVSGEYSNVFNLENAGCDEAYICIGTTWQGASGNAYYGVAVISVNEIIVS